jgi:ABC-type dipeptide/oligopeptide/nickel transport system permease component
MRMSIYIVRRLLLLLPVVLGVMTITFILTTGIPSSERCLATIGPPPTHGGAPAIAQYNAHCDRVLGLNQPVFVQWAYYMGNTLTFHWGVVGNNSYAAETIPIIAGQPVTSALSWLLPYTIELALLSLAIILIVAIPLGRLSAVYRNRPVDQAARVMSFSGYAIPTFLLGSLAVIAMVLVIANYHWAGCSGPYNEIIGSWPKSGCMPDSSPTNDGYPTWLGIGTQSHPTGFPTIDAAIHGQYLIALDTILRMIVPALIIAYSSIAVLLRFVRNSMLEVMNLDFIRTARAKGVPESVVVKRHAGRNSLNVTITVLGLTFAFFVGGFPIIEEVFGLQGVGRALALSVQQPYDLGLIFGSTILFTLIVVVANIIVDVVYAYLDPRVRLG